VVKYENKSTRGLLTEWKLVYVIARRYIRTQYLILITSSNIYKE